MQRRWAAICFAFFLVTAAGAYVTMAVAEEPELDLAGNTYQNNDTFAANGTTYTVQVEEGSGSLVYNRTVTKETTVANDSTVEYAGGTYRVTVESAQDPTRFGIVEEFDVEAILANDSRVDNRTYTGDDDTEFVRYRNGSTQPLQAYLPEPDSQTFSEGDDIEHAGDSKTVDNVTAQDVALSWETDEEQSTNFAHGENVTVGETTYVATFQSADTVTLSEDVTAYQQHVTNRQYFQERMSGLNYVVLFSLASGFLIVSMAFLPRRE